MKKVLAVLLLATLMLTVSLPNCLAEEKLVFGFSLSNQKQDRWMREEVLMRNFCEEKGIQLIVQVANDDAEKQKSQVETMLSNGADVIFLRPTDSKSAGVIGDMVHEAGAIYIAYDVLSLNGHVDYLLTFDCEEVGRKQATSLLEAIPDGGNVVMINGHPASNNCQLYYKGAMEVFQKAVDSGLIKIVADQWCEAFNVDLAYQHMENALTANNNDIQGVYTFADQLATPVVSALEGQGLAGKIPVVGQDADLVGCQRIVEGTQYSTIYKRVAELNRAACDIAYAAITGADVTAAPSNGVWGTFNNKFMDVPAYKLDVYTVTKDNMVDTVIADGWQQFEQVYANIPEDQRPK